MKLFATLYLDEIAIASRRSPYEIARRVAILLDTLTADEIEGQLLYI